MDNDFNADPLHTQRPTIKERLPRPYRYRRWRSYILPLLAVVLILGTASVTILLHQSSIRAQSDPKTHPATMPTPTTHATTHHTTTHHATTHTTTSHVSISHSTPLVTQAPSGKLQVSSATPTPTRQVTPPTPTPKPCPPMLAYGSQGSWVKTLQQRLNTLGFRDSRGNVLPVDGIFGPNTEYAVKQFQAKHALTADGIVGPKTWSALGYC